MPRIREFLSRDIPEVADLWLKVFRNTKASAPGPLRDYFDEIFFKNPWRDASLPSLVYEEDARGILGFLGVLPRTMTFKKCPIKVAVATQLMVDDGAAYAAVKLMRKFLTGKQDLSVSDGANEAAERLWQAAGGEVALLDSLAWTRVLRPTQYLMALMKRRESLTPVTKALSPVCQAVDAAVVRSPLGQRYWLPEAADTAAEEESTEETLLWCIRNLTGDRALQPEYELDTFRWLLRKASEKQCHGALRNSVVRHANGEILGWYLYYLEPGGIGQVLQFGGKPKYIRNVLHHLFHQAWDQGAVAISGKFEPRFAKELVQNRCGFTWPGYGVVVHSRDREILNAIHQGNAFFSRLEGEWWARFSDPGWLETDRRGFGRSVELQDAPRLNTAH